MKVTLLRLALGLTLSSGLASAAQIPDRRDTDSPYGVLDFFAWDQKWTKKHYNFDRIEKAAALMQEAGIKIVRVDLLWEDIEPKKGRYKFKKYDRIVKILDRHEIKTLAVLQYNPRWRKAAWNAAPDADGYIAYARATVRHFKDRVKYWEIWNEPDSKTYWLPQDELAAYSALLKRVYPAIKEEDPTAQVVLGGMTEAGPYSLRRIYQKVGPQYFDIINIHPFVDPKKSTAVETLKGIHTSLMRVMVEFNDAEKPIWFTELGAPGVQVNTPKNGWWHGPSPSEAEQAEWVRTVYREALKFKGVQKIFWAFFRDTDDFFHNGVDNFGLVRFDFSKKPAFDAYRETAQP